jgi:hypothetical protein
MGVKVNLGNASRILLLSKYTFANAVRAVSFVTNASLPVNIDLIASHLQTIDAMNGVTFLWGGFFPKQFAIAVNISL